MNRYLPQLVCLLCLLLGVSLGWYFGYTRPSIRAQQQLLQERRVARSFGMSEEDMADIDAQLPFLRRQIERSDEFAAQVALSALKDLEAGDMKAAKVNLGKTVSAYYRGHYTGNTNFVARIERFAATNAALSNAIYRALK